MFFPGSMVWRCACVKMEFGKFSCRLWALSGEIGRIALWFTTVWGNNSVGCGVFGEDNLANCPTGRGPLNYVWGGFNGMSGQYKTSPELAGKILDNFSILFYYSSRRVLQYPLLKESLHSHPVIGLAVLPFAS